MTQQTDRELRRAIAWLNNEGGFGNNIQYMRVKHAAEGLPFPIINNVIKVLLQEPNKIEDPTQWIVEYLNEERFNGGEDRWNDSDWPADSWKWSEPKIEPTGQTRRQAADSKWAGRGSWSESGGLNDGYGK